MTSNVSMISRPDADDPAGLAVRQLRIGQGYFAAGRVEDAISAYLRGLACVADGGACGPVAVETISELHFKLGNACMRQGDLEFATANYQAALRLSPGLTAGWCNLGNARLESGEPQEAIALYQRALTLDPGHWPSRTNLAQALLAAQQYVVAKALLTELARERPQDSQIRNQLGKACFALNQLDAAVDSFQQAVALNPRDSDSFYWIGGIRQRMGDDEAAHVAYVEAVRIKPLIRRPAAKSPAAFRVLALFAPFAGNLPTEYLFRDSAYDTDTLALFAGGEYDLEPLKPDVQVVVNLVSDADQGAAVLPLVADLVGQLGKPTVNCPFKVQRTTRDAVADLLDGIPACRVPKVLRHKSGDALSIAALQAGFPGSSIMLARPVGTHGGDDFEMFEDAAMLPAFLAQRPDTDHYLIEYIDYRSADGYFRKYRFIFVDGQILPYHLAIGSHWKLHHDSTDMASQPWTQQEELAFLTDPATVFDARHYQALRVIRERTGLDYFGIDCGLDRSGDLVVFEVNASMLVHDGNEKFPYKAPFVQRIKTAFDEMLGKFAA
jgi:tetratricopeptide (TPR) repeat protein